MSIEPGPSSSASPQNDFGSLQGCFVEGIPNNANVNAAFAAAR